MRPKPLPKPVSHAVGNHSYDHHRFCFLQTPAQLREDIPQRKKSIEAWHGRRIAGDFSPALRR